jgi:hypothetical protein
MVPARPRSALLQLGPQRGLPARRGRGRGTPARRAAAGGMCSDPLVARGEEYNILFT